MISVSVSVSDACVCVHMRVRVRVSVSNVCAQILRCVMCGVFRVSSVGVCVKMMVIILRINNGASYAQMQHVCVHCVVHCWHESNTDRTSVNFTRQTCVCGILCGTAKATI